MNVKKRNQKLIFTGGTLSMAGDSLFSTAVLYDLAQVNHASFYLSLATLILTIPSVFATFIGIFTDRGSSKKVILVARTTQATLCLGLIWYFKIIPVLLIIVFLLEMFATVNSVAGISLTAQLITSQDRSKIIGRLHAVQTAIQLAGRLFGAALFTLILPVGIAIINSGSFILALLSILGIRLPEKPKEVSKNPESAPPIRKGWVDGWKALYHDRLASRLTMAVAIGGAMSIPVEAYLSLILLNRLHSNTFEFGFAFAMEMIGGIIGGLLGSPIIKRVVSCSGYGIVFLFDFLMMGLSILLLGIASQYWVVVVMMLLLGLIQSFQNITAPTYIMQVNSSKVLGRVFGTITSTQALSAMFASFILTGISTVIPVAWILVVAGGLMCILSIVLFAFPIGVLKKNVQAGLTESQ